MQIVIDIDAVDYEYIKHGCIIPIKIDNHIYNAIRSGILLPKGHGRLIDADELYNSLEFPTQQFASAFKQVLDDASTIIEADTEQEEQHE